jgi:opacity protein-like surface antigen
MKKFAGILASAVVLFAAAAAAQNPPAQSGPGNSAINSPDQKNSTAPVSGANSFTEGQAKSRIEEAGYAGVTDLKKDDNGVWRGKATKGGATTDVSIDFQGNVNAAKSN